MRRRAANVRRALPHAAAALLALGAAAGLAAASVFRHDHFGSNAYDLGIFDQTVWGYSRFELVPSSIMRLPSPMAFHFHPIIMSLAPLYWLASDPRTLLVAQAALIAASSIPLFLYARLRLGSPAALLLQAAYLVFWGLIGASLFDFHEVAFAAPILSVALYALLTRRRALLVGALVLGLLTREDLALTVAAIAVFAAVRERDRRLFGAVAVAALAWFFVMVELVIPALGDGSYPWQYGALGEGPRDAVVFVVSNPIETLELFFSPHEKRLALFNLVAPWLLLPLASPLALLAVPTVAARFLSDNPSLWAPQSFHYSLVLAPIVAFAAVDGLERVSRRVRRGDVVAVAGAAALLVAGAYFTFVRLQPLAELERYATDAQIAGIERCLDQVPPDVSVAATSALVPHLSQRREVYVLDDRPVPSTDYYAVDIATWIFPFTHGDVARLVRTKRNAGYVVRCATATTTVLARGP